MKLLVAFFMLLTTLFNTQYKDKVDSQIFARSYVVMEQNSGKILESKDCNLKRSVASISKIMTAIIAIESDMLFKTVEVDEEINDVVGSSLYLSLGTKVDMIELVYGLLLRSGNDAAQIIAKNVGGSIENFVDKMNHKAHELKMDNTFFSNPSGLDMFDNGNISTSYDMALLMRYCMENESFVEITSCRNYKSFVKGNWKNKHKLLQEYEYANGGKTGYTKKAKRTLITSAKKDDLKLIIVTLDCGNDFAFHKEKFEYYFNNYQYITFLNKGMNYLLNVEIYVDKIYGVMVEIVKEGYLIRHYKIKIKEKRLKMELSIDSKKIFVDEIKIEQMRII